MNSHPQFSIIIVTFNRPTLIKQVLANLVSLDVQSPRFEVVVVNDGGEKETEAIIRSYEQALSIRYIASSSRLNSSVARNKAIDQAQGTHLIFLDDDVLLSRDFLMNVSKYVEHYDVFSCRIERHRPIRSSSFARFFSWITPGAIFPLLGYLSGGFDIVYSHPKRVHHLPGCMMVVKRSCCATVRFDPTLGMGNGYLDDADFSLSVERENKVQLWYISSFSLVHLQASAGGNREHDRCRWYFFYLTHKFYFFKKHFLPLYHVPIIIFSFFETSIRSIIWRENLFGSFIEALRYEIQ
ncbi:MAG TPA: glycosyltransferase family 2 protein [Candidatus Paceibacterota bacterium]|nr:glycosyltransferase family 2 protein [Candidatus Paceibacterota bacterium]